ncbi:MAG TPA: pyridoxamine 5'-phosphate oxidase [Anaerolineae bacterium]|nr:pyridoxamine 5'-phosphate oxidase [Anaerolineae bacterium]
MTLATYGNEGVWAAAVFYVNEGFTLYFLSAGHTRHARNILAQPHVAAAIQEDYADWPVIQGIQLEGDVQILEGEERDTAVTLYRRKYPFLNQINPQIEAALTQVNWYQLTPTRLYFIDNSKGLGHRDEVNLLRSSTSARS